MCTMVRDAGTKSGSPMWWRCFFLRDDSANEVCQFVVARAAAHLGVQVMIPDREQAGANLAVGGDADAAAMSAEGMRDGSDDADLADAIVEAVTSRGFGARVWDLDQRPVFRHARREFRRA